MNICCVSYKQVLLGVISVLLSAAGARAQTGAITLNPEKAITQFGHSSWNTLDGLPQNTVSAIVQTQDGYIWLGTQEGLVRFDGHQFTIFDRKNSDAFLVNTVNHLFESADGTLWIGTRGGGLLTFHDGTFSSVEGVSSMFSTALFEDIEGTMWLGTFSGGINRINQDGVAVYGEEQGLPGRVVSLIAHDGDGNLIVGTDSGVFIWSGDRFWPIEDDLLTDAYLTEYYVDADGDEWIGLRDGSFFRRSNGQVVDFSSDVSAPGAYLKSVWQDSRGSLWFGFRGSGLFRYANGSFSSFSEQHGLSSNAVLSLFEGHEGGLWIGTANGLDRLQDGKFEIFTTAEGLAHNDAKSIFEDPSGALWIATRGGGISRLKDGEFTHFNTSDGLSSNDVQAVAGTAEGQIWAGTSESGLNRIDATGIETFTVENGLSGNEIYALYTDSNGTLWIGTGGGISIFDGTTFTNLTAEVGLSSSFVTDFAERVDGGMWVSTYDGGLNLIQGDSISVLTTDDGLFSNAILALYSDSEGTLWIGTYGEGLNVLRDGKIYGITARQGLSDDTIFSILEDDEGALWFSSNRGLFAANKQALLALALGETDRVKSTLYGVSDGLKTAEANGGQQPSSWKGANGKLWFPMATGIASIDPAHIRLNGLQPAIEIEHFWVDSKAVLLNESKGIELRPGSDKLEFDYTALSFPAPEKVLYEVKLDGYDAEWNPVGTRREAFYTNLDPGTYAFRVRAQNNDGVWAEQGATVNFVLRPFFYQTRWFMFTSILFLLIAATVAYRVRIEQLRVRERELERTVDERTHDLRIEKENVERAKDVIEDQAEQLMELDQFKTRFFSNVSHEFRTPLTMLIGPLENVLAGTYGSISESMRHQSEIMLRNARRLMRLINQLLDLSKLEAGKMELKTQELNVVPFVQGIVSTFSPLAEKKNLELTFETISEDIEVYFEPDKLEKVLYNLLSNAAKFTPQGGRISVAIESHGAQSEFANGSVRVLVADTGRGISAEDLPFIFDRFRQARGHAADEQESTGIGLALVQELVTLHSGRINVESELDDGTTISIELPLGRKHLQDDEVMLPSEIKIDNTTDALSHVELSSKHLHQSDVEIATESPGRQMVQGDAPTILVVEDNRDVREFVAAILESEYYVIQAFDGQDGWEKMHANMPDMVVADVVMPRMDGNELCRKIKENERLNHIPVLILTGRASLENKLAVLGLGADDYMTKPFNAHELQVRVRNLIKLRNQDKQLKILNEGLEHLVKEQVDMIVSERNSYENQLIAARDKAESSSRMKSSILSNLNHEFRTPLSTILGCSQILIDEAPPELKEFAQAVELSGNRLLKTLNGVIELADIESMDFEADLQRLDAMKAAEESADVVREMAEAKGITVRITSGLTDRPFIQVPATVLAKILNILLANAVKFTENGQVEIALFQAGDVLEFQIRDTGCGIATEVIGSIFEAFVQGDGDLNRSHEGCGVGLSVASSLANKVGWRLHVESVLNQGSTFTLGVPYEDEYTLRHPVERKRTHQSPRRSTA